MRPRRTRGRTLMANRAIHLRPAHHLRSALRLVRGLGPQDLQFLLWVLVVVGGLWLFLGVAEAVRKGETHALDERVLWSLRHPGRPSDPIGPPGTQEVMRDLTALGSNTVLLLFTAAVCVYLLVRRDTHAFVLVAGAALGGLVIVPLLKDLYERPRPDPAFHLVRVHSSSFPSGHSMSSAVVYLTLGALLSRVVTQRKLKLYFIAVAMFLSFLVGLSRVYLGIHYPSDVLAGWTAGLVWAVLWWAVARYLQRRGKIAGPEGAAAPS